MNRKQGSHGGKGLKKAAFSAVTWTTLDMFGRQAIHFVISVILARILAPEDFGIIAIMMVFIALADTFVDSGLSAALTQKPNVTAQDENTMFHLNVVMAILLYGAVWVAAPHIAHFYNLPALTLLLRIFALDLVIRSFYLIQTTLFRKRLDFRPIFLSALIALPISGGLGVFLAYRGFGVWSLVVQQLVNSAVSLLNYWLMSNWRPKLIFSTQSFRALTGYGSRQLAVGLLDTFFQNIYQLIIGKLFAPAALGFYSRALNTQKLVSNNLTQIVNRVAFPLLCAAQGDTARLHRAASGLLSVMAMVVFPCMAGMMVVAEPLVDTLLTSKWLPCVPYLQLLCIVGILTPFHVINVNLMRATAKMDIFLKLEILKKGLIVVAILLTYRWGIIAMIWGQIAVSVVNYFLNAHFGGRPIGYSWLRQLKDVAPYGGVTLAMAGAAAAAGLIPTGSPLVRLIAQTCAGAVVYVACCHLFGLREYHEVRSWGMRHIKNLRVKAGWAVAQD
ncbi:MAG: Lipopolysaccharide biosynthesis protein WzxC [Syntrophus sp. PtaB.Bin138]|nr:MAG: Lipopolysaccharide biosynthesis protein WzxC [Syntrophus sp. PtaB.Bin138]